LFLLLLIETTDYLSGTLFSTSKKLTCCCRKHWIVYRLFLQELLQIQSNPTQATRDFSSSNRGILLNQVCSSFEESKNFEFDRRLDVLVVAEVFQNRIWGRLFVLIHS